MASAPIAILSDFGLSDPFVGIMKGVIAGLAPEIPSIDLSHEIGPGDLQTAALTLWQSAPFFPPGTVFLAVVDPGVGTSRRALILEHRQRRFIGPDNGIFSYFFDPTSQVYALQNPDYRLDSQSTTFHGRDIFAPAAAFAALGRPLETFGPVVADPVTIRLPRLICHSAHHIEGEVLKSDRFGNLLTSLGRFQAHRGSFEFSPWIGKCDRRSFPIQEVKVRTENQGSLAFAATFADIPTGECRYLIGSTGLLELAANRAQAVALLKMKPGDPVHFMASRTNKVQEQPD